MALNKIKLSILITLLFCFFSFSAPVPKARPITKTGIVNFLYLPIDDEDLNREEFNAPLDELTLGITFDKYDEYKFKDVPIYFQNNRVEEKYLSYAWKNCFKQRWDRNKCWEIRAKYLNGNPVELRIIIIENKDIRLRPVYS